ncbi:acyltransferase [Aquipseudomonas campi]|uniref:Acyltransferase n=1 Tax=Aquipseudomonas campi TaxID=2731681 RepID=A0A6M8G874_9GAMM|nr:acyltransferase [Pseudomonas campi]QKE65035.1 acyltransferase [Pseudomonas campi]
MPQKRLAVLDDFRAIAITLVVAMHGFTTFFPRIETSENPLLILLLSGGTGVTLFFILSGFLVTRPFIEAELYDKTVSLKDYAIQRALRILPLYYLAVLFATLAIGDSSKTLDAILFNAKGFDFAQYSTVWWSLIVEVHFYILVPLLYMACKQTNRKTLLSLLLLGWLTFYSSYALELLPISPTARKQLGNSLLCQLHAFLIGFLLSIMYSRKVFFGQKTLALASTLISGALLVVILLPRMETAINFHSKFPLHALGESALWGAMLYSCVILGKNFLGALGRFLARTSYSLYLAHMPVFYAFFTWHKAQPQETALAPIAVLLMATATATLLSTVLYYLVEKPFLNLKERVRQRQPVSKSELGSS